MHKYIRILYFSIRISIVMEQYYIYILYSTYIPAEISQVIICLHTYRWLHA